MRNTDNMSTESNSLDEITMALDELASDPFVQSHLLASDIAQASHFDDLIFKIINRALERPFNTDEANFLHGANLGNFLTINRDANSDLENWMERHPEILAVAYLQQCEIVTNPETESMVLENSDLIFGVI